MLNQIVIRLQVNELLESSLSFSIRVSNLVRISACLVAFSPVTNTRHSIWSIVRFAKSKFSTAFTFHPLKALEPTTEK